MKYQGEELPVWIQFVCHTLATVITTAGLWYGLNLLFDGHVIFSFMCFAAVLGALHGLYVGAA